MSDWPDDWFRQGAGAGGAPAGPGGASGGTGAADPTVRLRARAGQPGAGPAAGTGGARPGGPGPAWPSQPPPRSAPGGGRPGGPGGAGRRRFRPRRIVAIICAVLALVIVVVAGMYFYLGSQLNKKNVLVNYSGRPAASAGQNWLIAGSDSRQGLTAKQERQLATGHDIGGHRSDTVMILHIPANGGPSVLVSLPRDSYVPIPGYGDNKLNAAFSFGGPKLLAKTVQNVTGLRIDHYMEIGFGGFVHVVDAVGGVRMCLKTSLYDQASGARLKKGCQTLDGDQALAYVRTRHNFSDQDLQRVQDQRLFMRALLTKLTSPGVILNPFASVPAALGVANTVTVDQGTSLYQLIKAAFALRHPETTTVPIANSNYATAAGDAVQWNSAEATQLFNDLKNDQPVPKSLLTGSKQAP
jgi:LCP family protein required for cell wall assembly